MSGLSIELRDVTQRYGDVVAVDDLSLRIEGGCIVGLLGRNGSGKSTLLSILAAFRKASAGTVLIDGVDPFENPAVCSRTCLVRESGDVLPTEKVRNVLDLAARLRSTWDADLAERLVERFGLPLGKRTQHLSRGQRSALGVTIGLASRAPLTMLDESYLGMDAPSRKAFYEELLAEYVEHPRTFILSTHLIDEVAPLFEDVVIIDRGRLLLHESAEELRSRGAAVVGPTELVESFCVGRQQLSSQRLGGTTSIVVYGTIDDGDEREARRLGLSLEPVGIQDLFVHLTEPDVAAVR